MFYLTALPIAKIAHRRW